jgi:hypothetical protein
MSANVVFMPKDAPAWVQNYPENKEEVQDFWREEMGRIGVLVIGVQYEVIQVV